MSEKQDKLDLINKLLTNDDCLNEYIETIEQQKIRIPKKLKENISDELSLYDSIEQKSKKRNYTVSDILKVACFALVTVFSWEFGISKINNFDYFSLKEKSQSIYQTNQKTNLTNKLGEFMMDDIIKGGEKK